MRSWPQKEGFSGLSGWFIEFLFSIEEFKVEKFCAG
jgi:hypothetical protein